jgi:hypothetical protein
MLVRREVGGHWKIPPHIKKNQDEDWCVGLGAENGAAHPESSFEGNPNTASGRVFSNLVVGRALGLNRCSHTIGKGAFLSAAFYHLLNLFICYSLVVIAL